MITAILVIDMINEYANEKGKIFCKTAPDIIPNINKLIEFGRNLSWDVIFVNTELKDNKSILAKKWGMQAEVGTWASETVPEINKQASDTVVPKTTFDGFYETKLEEVLKKLKIKNVIVTGIHTHVCVHFTAMSAANRGYNVIALEECMTTGYLENHNSRLRLYKTHIGELFKLEEFLQKEYKNYVS